MILNTIIKPGLRPSAQALSTRVVNEFRGFFLIPIGREVVSRSLRLEKIRLCHF